MIDSALIVQLVAAVFFLVVGIRLIMLSWRTGETPEKLLGAYFVFTGLAYVLWQLPLYFEQAMTGNPIDLVSWALYCVGVIPFVLFARLVFRPEIAWATGLVRFCIVALVAGMTAWIVQGEEYYVFQNPWYWAVWLGYSIPCLWFAIEAFLCHASAKRRVRIGLCDHVVANRYLLFALFGVFQTSACFNDLATTPMETSLAFQRTMASVTGAIEMCGIVTLFLAFFPPVFYQRWLESATVPESIEG